MTYTIYLDGNKVKQYETEEQTITWCYLNKFISCGRCYLFLDKRVRIEVEV